MQRASSPQTPSPRETSMDRVAGRPTVAPSKASPPLPLTPVRNPSSSTPPPGMVTSLRVPPLYSIHLAKRPASTSPLPPATSWPLTSGSAPSLSPPTPDSMSAPPWAIPPLYAIPGSASWKAPKPEPLPATSTSGPSVMTPLETPRSRSAPPSPGASGTMPASPNNMSTAPTTTSSPTPSPTPPTPPSGASPLDRGRTTTPPTPVLNRPPVPSFPTAPASADWEMALRASTLTTSP